MEEKVRNSNVELLRLVLMAFVVILHFNNATMGGAFAIVKDYPFEHTLFSLFESFCICAVNCFMIVSGYFLFTNTKVKIGKVFDILIIVVFYQFFDFVGQLIFLDLPFSLKHFITCCLPNNYFAIFYVICYIFSPFIARFFRDNSIRTVNWLIGILLILFIIIPSLLDSSMDILSINYAGFLSPISVLGNGAGYTIVQFFTMLCLGMWLRKTEFTLKNWILLIIYISSCIMIFLFSKRDFAFNYDLIFNVLAAVSLFLLFSKMTINSKCINFLSRSCFSIYCIHVGEFALFTWRKYFIKAEHFSNGIIISILWMLFSVLVMYSACLLISIIMRGIFCKIKNSIGKRLVVINDL